jgi:pimeloyl-ACP methyl ester carboxylesterase
MRRALRIVGLTIGVLVVLVGVLIAVAFGYRSYRQHENHLAMQILSPAGIDEARFVPIGGLPQWIQIRGEDRANPVLLFVHGGPAMSMIPFTFRSMRPWEKYFTIVQWDQRGAGRTYIHNGGADSTSSGMNQIIDDGLRVTDYIRSRLGKDKIIVMGESWGSAVALEMVHRRPDLFYAYVGTGQAIDMPRADVLTYRLLLERLQAEHNESDVQQLTSIGPPPYVSAASTGIEQGVLGRYLSKSENDAKWARDFLFAPGYSLRDLFEVLAGATSHRAILVKDDDKYSAFSHGTQFIIPVFFFQGTDDIVAPLQLVREYVSQVTAPSKELILFPGGGHNAFYFMSDCFLHELVTRVRPVAMITSLNGAPGPTETVAHCARSE